MHVPERKDGRNVVRDALVASAQKFHELGLPVYVEACRQALAADQQQPGAVSADPTQNKLARPWAPRTYGYTAEAYEQLERDSIQLSDVKAHRDRLAARVEQLEAENARLRVLVGEARDMIPHADEPSYRRNDWCARADGVRNA